MKTVIILNIDQIGHGDRAIGQKILGTFLRKSPAMDEVTAIVFFNNGVKLATKESPVLTELTLLQENGVDLKLCGTCLDHFGLEPAVGSVSNMDEIIREMDKAEKVITL